MDTPVDTAGARRVAVLPEALANQIAAGEVVERPASVVKELLDNALDAEASRIFVEVRGGGAALIRVLDDGLGMSPEDAALAIQRHATSKVRTAHDLAAISTLGFRGEALPSIASVSRFTLVTRQAGAPVATRISVDGGGPPTVREAGAPVGTQVEVRDLFHNVPARLKFLKRPATEFGHITQLVTACALGYPYVHVRLTVDDRVTLDHPPAKTLSQRIFQVLGRKIAAHTFEVRADGEVRVRGFLSGPSAHRHNAAQLHTFINGRHVRDRVVTHAITQAYADFLPRGRSPVGVLYVHVPPTAIDVNVHPAKAEVRFVNAGRVHQAIFTAVKAMLAASPWLRLEGTSLYGGRSPAAPRRPGTSAAGAEGEPAPTTSTPGASDPARAPAPPVAPTPRSPRKAGGPPSPPPPVAHELVFSDTPPRALVDEAPPATPPAAPSGRLRGLRVLGTVRGGLVVCEGAQGLVVVDGPAGHALVLEHELRLALGAGEVPARELLFPVQLEPARAQAAALRAHGGLLARLGLRVEPFGGGTWQLTAVPAPLAEAPPAALLTAALDGLARGDDAGSSPAALVEEVARALARAAAGLEPDPGAARHAPSGGHQEAQALLRRLDALPEDFGHRPPALTLPWGELTGRLRRG